MMLPDVRGGALEVRGVVLFHAARVFNVAQMPFGVNKIPLWWATRMAAEVEGVVRRAPRVDQQESWLTLQH